MTISKESIGGFWTFDTPREEHFDVPSKGELGNIWQKYHGNGDFLDLHEPIYGVCEQPDEKPSLIVALDLCEVVRETGLSLARVRNGDLSALASNPEGTTSDYSAEFNGWHPDESSRYITTLAQEFMHHDHVPAVPYNEAITAFIQRWKQAGAYVVADTSTLPGCEASTIRFLSEKYPGCFNGILFPRNHDGLGSVTKADALAEARYAIEEIGDYSLSDTPIVFIEDTPHHAKGFITAFDDVQVFTPEYDWNYAIEDHHRVDRIQQRFGTLDAFIAADNYLVDRGIL